jgi:hypothetical protein
MNSPTQRPTPNCRSSLDRIDRISLEGCDADGQTLEAPGLTTNQKVRVHYMKTAGENVADRVILVND